MSALADTQNGVSGDGGSVIEELEMSSSHVNQPNNTSNGDSDRADSNTHMQSEAPSAAAAPTQPTALVWNGKSYNFDQPKKSETQIKAMNPATSVRVSSAPTNQLNSNPYTPNSLPQKTAVASQPQTPPLTVPTVVQPPPPMPMPIPTASASTPSLPVVPTPTYSVSPQPATPQHLPTASPYPNPAHPVTPAAPVTPTVSGATAHSTPNNPQAIPDHRQAPKRRLDEVFTDSKTNDIKRSNSVPATGVVLTPAAQTSTPMTITNPPPPMAMPVPISMPMAVPAVGLSASMPQPQPQPVGTIPQPVVIPQPVGLSTSMPQPAPLSGSMTPTHAVNPAAPAHPANPGTAGSTPSPNPQAQQQQQQQQRQVLGPVHYGQPFQSIQDACQKLVPFRTLMVPPPPADDWSTKFAQQAESLVSRAVKLENSLQELLHRHKEQVPKEEYLLLEKLRYYEEKHELDQQKARYAAPPALPMQNTVFNLAALAQSPGAAGFTAAQVLGVQPTQFYTTQTPQAFYSIQATPQQATTPSPAQGFVQTVQTARPT